MPVFEALDIVNVVSMVLVVVYCLLWVTVLCRSPKFRLRSRYVVGTAVALLLWHLPGFITLVGKADNVLCDNSITRGSEANHLCTAQGFIFIFSTHAVVCISLAFQFASSRWCWVGPLGCNSYCVCSYADEEVEYLLPSTRHFDKQSHRMGNLSYLCNSRFDN